MTPERPKWLPELVPVDGTDDDILARLRQIWLRDFKQQPIVFQGMRIVWDQQLRPGEDLESGFWHIVSRDASIVGLRQLDRERASRLPWCLAILQNEAAPELLIWENYADRGRRRIYIWYQRGRYVVVLEPRARAHEVVAYLVTAFVVDGASHERQLRKRFNGRIT